jgi:hypothetical protein
VAVKVAQALGADPQYIGDPQAFIVDAATMYRHKHGFPPAVVLTVTGSAGDADRDPKLARLLAEAVGRFQKHLSCDRHGIPTIADVSSIAIAADQGRGEFLCFLRFV